MTVKEISIKQYSKPLTTIEAEEVHTLYKESQMKDLTTNMENDLTEVLSQVYLKLPDLTDMMLEDAPKAFKIIQNATNEMMVGWIEKYNNNLLGNKENYFVTVDSHHRNVDDSSGQHFVSYVYSPLLLEIFDNGTGVVLSWDNSRPSADAIVRNVNQYLIDQAILKGKE